MIHGLSGHLTDIHKELFHYASQFFLVEYVFKNPFYTAL